MCGIAGIYNLNGEPVTDPPVLLGMVNQMRHRGPDDKGFFYDGPIGLGMRRLSIIDVEGGHQPISTEQGRVTLVCNGEIYNFRELKQSLEKGGHVFSTGSDAEVIGHLYEKEGPLAVTKLNGMFGFALWDRKERCLFIARDRLGIKPVYYAVHRGVLLFASEIKAILAYPGFPRQVDPVALDAYFSYRYVLAPRTLYQGVQKLLPGHWLQVRNGRIQIQRYWDVPVLSGGPRSARWYEQELEERLKEAVRLRLVSDVPLGSFLSGGLDSSLITALMQQQSVRPIETFSIGFDGPADESCFSQAVAKNIGSRHHLRRVSMLEANQLPRILWHLDEPIADPAVLPVYLLAQFARQKITVALTGEGADELFGGYQKYRYDAWIRLYRRFPAGVRNRFLDRLLSRLPWVVGQHENDRLFRMDDVKRRLAWDELFLPRLKAALYGPTLQKLLSVPSEEPLSWSNFNSPGKLDQLNAMLWTDMKTSLADDLLMKVDKMTMAHALEARTPFLDHRVVEFAFRVPDKLKLSWCQNKILLRRVAGRYLPASIAKRQKHGFSVPIAAWFRNKLGQDLMRLVDSSSHDWINPAGIHRMLQEHLQGRADRSRELWAVLCFELWHRRMIECRPEATWS